MMEHRLFNKVIPECPECNAPMDSASGPDSAPQDGDCAICAYCTTVSQYKAVEGGFVFERMDMNRFTEEDQEAILKMQQAIKEFNENNGEL